MNLKSLINRFAGVFALLACLVSTQAAILVGPTGSQVYNFSATPLATDWSTIAAGVGTGDPAYTSAAVLDADVIAQTDATAIAAALLTSGTVPPSASPAARRHTANNYIQMRCGTAGYAVLLARLQNDSGATAAFLNVSYDYNQVITTAFTEQIPGLRAYWSLTGLPESWQPIPQLTTATPRSPLTASIEVGSWPVGAAMYLLWVDDNAAGDDGAYTIDNFSAATAAGREPSLATFNGTATQFTARILDGAPAAMKVKESSVTATIDGTATSSTTVTSADGFVTIQGIFPTLAQNTAHTVVISFTDNDTPAKSYTITQSLNVGPYQVIPASLAVTGVNTSSNGFKAFVHQIGGPRLSPDGTNTVGGTFDGNSTAAAEWQLGNHYIDPNTGVISQNFALANPDSADGLYPFDVINWNQGAPTPPAGETGNFHSGSIPPNEDVLIPGVQLTPDYITAEIFTFVELKAGRLYRMGVNSDDGFKVTVGPNARDISAMTLGGFNGGRGASDTLFEFMVEADGIYPMRLLWWEGTGGANVEWFTVDDAGQKVLLNDRSVATHVKAYSSGPALPPYVKAVWPAAGSTNAPGDMVLGIDLTDGSTTVVPGTIKLFVNNQDVTGSAVINKAAGAADTTVTYDPAGTLAPETSLAVRLIYGDSASQMRTNEFTIRVHPRLYFDVTEGANWSFNDTGADLGTAWRAKDFDDSAWLRGPALIGFDSPTVEPVRTTANRYKEDQVTQVTTYYFRTHFTYSGSPAAVKLFIRHVVDDGAVFYLNGQEIYRFGLAAGATFDATTFFSSNENAWRGPFEVPKVALLNGDNVIAVEVHSTAADSSDMIFGAQLFSVQDPSVGPARVASFTPLADSTNHPASSPINFLLEDGSTSVNPSSIQLTVNGSAVTPTINKPAGGILTTISYLPPGGFVYDTVYNVKLEFRDDAAQPATTIQEFSFRTARQALVDFNAETLWRYDRSGSDLGTAWRERVFDDALWPEGAALIADETGAMPIPIRTPVSRFNDEGTFVTTMYFRKHFNFTGNPATALLFLRHVVDDGAVFYLNGQELTRLGLGTGVPYTSATYFAGHEAVMTGPIPVPNSALLMGDNVFAVEVHQSDGTSSDIVFGAELTLGINPDVGPAAVVSALPVDGSINQTATSSIQYVLQDGLTQVVPGSIKLTVNGAVVTPVISKPAGGIMTTVSYTPSVPYAAESIVNVKLEFSDDGTPANATINEFSFQVYPGLEAIFNAITQTWRYANDSVDLGTAWKEKTFDDSQWLEGLPLFLANETGATIEVAQTPTLLRVGSDGTTPIITDYFRTHFNFTGDPANTRLAIRLVVDDGAVVYLNGQEVHRFGFDTNTTTVTNLTVTLTDHEGRDHYDGPFIIPSSALVAGDNVLAVEVHQNSPTSSDMIFGLELNRVTSNAPQSVETRFETTTLVGGQVRISWTGPGRLQENTDIANVNGWTDVQNPSNPYVSAPGGVMRFFRIIQ